MNTKLLFLFIGGILLLSLLSVNVFAIKKTVSQKDFFPKNEIKLEINGIIVAHFKEVSGLESESEIILNKIVLKRGFVNDPSIIRWFNEIIDECESISKSSEISFVIKEKKFSKGFTNSCEPRNESERKSGSVIILDRSGGEVLRYNFFEAWPTRWKAPSLDSKGDTHMIEELEFVVEKIERA